MSSTEGDVFFVQTSLPVVSMALVQSFFTFFVLFTGNIVTPVSSVWQVATGGDRKVPPENLRLKPLSQLEE